MTGAKSHRDLAKALIRALGYTEDERVRAVFLVGSSATGEGDDYSDVDVMVIINAVIADDERLRKLRGVGCRNIVLAIAGIDNPALPVKSQVIDKFVFRDTWFDVSYHLPHQLEFYFDYATLVDKDGLTPQLCAPNQTHTDAQFKARVKADLRLLRARVYRFKKYARRREWIGLDLSAIKNLIVDVVMVLNDRPNYNRYSARISQQLHGLQVKPVHFEQTLSDILRLDDRETWQRKLEMLRQLEADLLALCEARWGSIAMYDDEER